jgi:hypothetical protein
MGKSSLFDHEADWRFWDAHWDAHGGFRGDPPKRGPSGPIPYSASVIRQFLPCPDWETWTQQVLFP